MTVQVNFSTFGPDLLEKQKKPRDFRGFETRSDLFSVSKLIPTKNSIGNMKTLPGKLEARPEQ